jgi:hypothetical protein
LRGRRKGRDVCIRRTRPKETTQDLETSMTADCWPGLREHDQKRAFLAGFSLTAGNKSAICEKLSLKPPLPQILGDSLNIATELQCLYFCPKKAATFTFSIVMFLSLYLLLCFVLSVLHCQTIPTASYSSISCSVTCSAVPT